MVAQPPVMEQARRGAIQTKSESLGTGCLVQLIGLLLCFTCYGAIIGVPLLIWGHFASYYPVCSECGMKLTSRKVKLCPACKAYF
jgi:hypothetical protein